MTSQYTRVIRILNELKLPRSKIGFDEDDSEDRVTLRKLKKQEQAENKYIRVFFETLEKYQKEGAVGPESFIWRYYKYIEPTTEGVLNPDISISQLQRFVMFLGKEDAMNKVARTIGMLKGRKGELTRNDLKKIAELKNDLTEKFLNPIKRIMRGTDRDETHSSRSHPIDIVQRFDAMRIRNIMRRWAHRKER